MRSCSQAHEIMARKWSRALFAVRPGLVPSSATARSWTQSRNSRISFRPRFSISAPPPHSSHFLRVVWYSSRVPRAGLREPRYFATAVLRVVGIGYSSAIGTCVIAKSSRPAASLRFVQGIASGPWSEMERNSDACRLASRSGSRIIRQDRERHVAVYGVRWPGITAEAVAAGVKKNWATKRPICHVRCSLYRPPGGQAVYFLGAWECPTSASKRQKRGLPI